MFLSLQYLRGIAALMVVAFHAADYAGRAAGAEPNALFAAGLSGVDLFFVISGFVMIVSTADRDVRPLAFLWKRLIRIAPLYWLLTLLLANVALLAPSLLSTTLYDGGHLLASLAFLPYRHPILPATVPMLVPGWTLNYEMAFYLVFALSLLLPTRWQVPAVVGVLLFAVSLRHLIPYSHAGGFYTMPLILEFGAGMLIARAVATGIAIRPWLAGLVFALGWAALFSLAGGDHWRSIASGAPAALIVVGAVFLERGRRLPVLPPLRWLGDASYSIYLTHVLTLPVLAKLWTAAGLPASAWFIAVCLAAAVLVGTTVYHLVERPLLREMRHWRLGPRMTAKVPVTSGQGRPNAGERSSTMTLCSGTVQSPTG